MKIAREDHSTKYVSISLNSITLPIDLEIASLIGFTVKYLRVSGQFPKHFKNIERYKIRSLIILPFIVSY